jgi:hypothetical protein
VTLILTAITRQCVVQLADMRLTGVVTGSVRDEATAKMVAYAGRFVFSFTGPACMDAEPTAQWIARVLSGIQEPSKVLVTLAAEAEPILRRYPENRRRLAIVGAGWLGEARAPRSVYLQVANFEFATGKLLSGFAASGVELQPTEKLKLFAAGASVPADFLGSIEKLMRRRAGRHRERSGEFAAHMRRAAWIVADNRATVGKRVLIGSIPGVHDGAGPPLFQAGMIVPFGRPDWHQPVYLYVSDRPGETRITTPAFAAPGMAIAGASIAFGPSASFSGPPPNPCR